MKKTKLLVLAGLISVLLMGCQSKKEAVEVTSTTQKTETTTTTSTKEIAKKNLWNDKKDQELHQFMTAWSKEMKQDYQFYDEKAELKWNDQTVSKKAVEKLKTIEVDKKEQQVEVFPKEEKENQLNIVAIASDEADSQPENHHLYFFALEGKTPKVLIVSEESTAKKIVAAETQNEALKQGFKTIVTGEKPKEDNRFASLPDGLKALLATELVDERLIKDFDFLNRPSAMYFNYFKDGDFYYVYFTSGAGVGHPLYLFKEEQNGFSNVQTIVRESANEYKELPAVAMSADKKTLVDKYEANKAKYDQALTNFEVKEEPNLKETYANQCKHAGIQNKAQATVTENKTASKQPSAEEIYGYYRDYVIEDAPNLDAASLRERMTMRGVDDRGLPIIKHMVHGSEIEIELKGDRIEYVVYGIGGVNTDGTPAKSHMFSAYYNISTGEHGLF